jgi:hypothetical protein
LSAVLLWLLNTYVTMDATIRTIINVVVVGRYRTSASGDAHDTHSRACSPGCDRHLPAARHSP